MITKIKTRITELSTFAKTILVFVPVVVGAAKLITIHDSNILAKSRAQQEQTIDSTLLQSVAIQVDLIKQSVEVINDNQVVISGQVDVLVRKFDTQSKFMGIHFQKENQLQDKIDYLQELMEDEKKNKNLNLSVQL